MILRRLIEFYDRKHTAREDPVPSFGFSRERISFELLIDGDGANPELFDLRSPDDLAGKRKAATKSKGRWMNVPYRGDRSSNVKPNFLWDNTGYVFGRTKSGEDGKKHSSFVSLHKQLASLVSDPGLEAVLRFLSSWKPAHYDQFPLGSEAIGENVVFRIRGTQRYVHESPALRSAWVDFFRNDFRQKPGVDLIGGQSSAIAEIHFLVQGVQGAQPTGASISSFNDTAYTSYGLKSSYNSPVSLENIFKYATALRELLIYGQRKVSLGETTVVFWAERKTPLEEFVSDLFGEARGPRTDAPPEDRKRTEEVRLFLSQLCAGHGGSVAVDPEDSTRFYILGLSPNASRISVRFWADSTVGEMKARLAQHMQDVELVGARDSDPPPMIRRIVLATGRAESDWSYDADSVSPLLAGAIARAVLTGGPYPQALLAAMINRIRADGVINHVRVASIKACLVRNSRLKGNPKEVSVALDTSRSDPAYVTGRLFALLEKIQEDSIEGKLNATIKDRYFSSASATPGVVFPRLIRLSQHHLAKIEGGLKVYREKQLGEVISKLAGFPGRLNLEEQGLFAVGYFHQRQDLFTSKGKKQTEGESE